MNTMFLACDASDEVRTLPVPKFLLLLSVFTKYDRYLLLSTQKSQKSISLMTCDDLDPKIKLSYEEVTMSRPDCALGHSSLTRIILDAELVFAKPICVLVTGI